MLQVESCWQVSRNAVQMLCVVLGSSGCCRDFIPQSVYCVHFSCVCVLALCLIAAIPLLNWKPLYLPLSLCLLVQYTSNKHEKVFGCCWSEVEALKVRPRSLCSNQEFRCPDCGNFFLSLSKQCVQWFQLWDNIKCIFRPCLQVNYACNGNYSTTSDRKIKKIQKKMSNWFQLNVSDLWLISMFVHGCLV